MRTGAFTCSPPRWQDDLFRYLAEVSAEMEGKPARWVMDPEWRIEVLRLTGPGGLPLWEPPLYAGGPELLLGRPMETRANAGAPHLEDAPR